jgi:zinc transporter ZupT
MNHFIQLLSCGLLAAAGNLLGGFLITRLRSALQIQLQYLVALGAGFMLAAVLLEALPIIIQQWEGQSFSAMVWLLAGYLLIQLVEHTLAPHFHFGEEVHAVEMARRGVAATAVGAFSIHAFFDGVTIASGLLTNFKLGIVLFIAVLLHKVPEGFTVASIVISSGRDRLAARRATMLVAAATLAGIISLSYVEPVVVYALPFSAGVTLYVAASDLIPEVNRPGGTRTSLLVFAGVVLFYLTHLFLHVTVEP